MKMKGKSFLILVLSIVVIAATVYVALFGIGSVKNGSAGNVTLGLDLAGGVSITYATAIDNPDAQDVADTIYKLQKRIDEKGYTEGEVYQEGNNRINVDIPGVSDATQVLEELGKPGLLQFVTDSGEVVITGDDIEDAKAYQDSSDLNSQFKIELILNAQGKDKFSQATAENVGRRISIMYNDEVIMSPNVKQQISGGIATITGLASFEAANEVASTIRIGALPLELVELRSNVVGAKMGQDAIDTSVKAGIIGILIIFCFMMVFYRLPGLMANIGLVLYAALTIVIISAFGITLTLPGIAGLILSVGMAVDANIIIFARIREELAVGKTLKASVKAGFKKALSAILDGNVTTFIAAMVLLFMGTGPIKGFAVTLALGLMVSLFTSLVITRLLLMSLANLGIQNKALYGLSGSRKPLKVFEKRWIWFSVSIAVIVLGMVMLPINSMTKGSPLNYDIEFVGGTSTLVTVNDGQGYDTYEALEADLRDIVVEATGDVTPQFQNVKGKDEFIIKTLTLDNAARIKLEDALISKLSITNANIQSETISATVSKEMKRDAILAIVIAAIFILLYITIRFKDYRYGLSAVIALLHDVLVVLAVYSVLGVAVNNSFIAAMLTIVGYSINDTIVVFDRVRENQRHMKRGDYVGVVDLSVSQTLSRSINTSLTTFIMVLVLYIVGVASIEEFALPLMVGIISGTYSSIFIASPLWVMFKKAEEKKGGLMHHGKKQ